MTQSEVNGFLERVPQAANDIAGHQVSGQPGQYDFNGPLRFDDGAPRKAYIDWDATYVLVWLDASRRWDFVSLADMPDFAAEVNKPAFVSPDASFSTKLAAQLGLTEVGGLTSSLLAIPQSIAAIPSEINQTIQQAVQGAKDSLQQAEKAIADSFNLTIKSVVIIALFAAVILGIMVWRGGFEAPGLKVK